MGKNFFLEKRNILLIVWFLVISLIYFHTTDAFDQDLGRHLKIGEIIWQTKEVPKTNLFSYTNPDESVFNSHWGSQVIFYGAHKAFGVNGLILLSTIINTAAFGMLGWLVVRQVGFVIPSLLLIPIVFLLLDRTWIRPEMFGNLFYAIILVALFSPRARKIVKWFFPAIALLWINLHITGVVGFFAMGVVLIQDIIEGYRKNTKYEIRNTKQFSKFKFLKLETYWVLIFRAFVFVSSFDIRYSNLIILLLIGLAVLINPYGLQGVLSAFTVLNKYGYTIIENQSWVFLKDFGFPLVGHIFFGFFTLAVSFFIAFYTKRKPLIGEVILLVVISLLTFRYVRNEVLFAYTVFLTAAFNVGKIRKLWKLGRLGMFGAFGVILVVSYLILTSHNSRGLPAGFGSKENYRAGVDYFLQNNIKGPIFNNFDIGGYLIYRLYPKEKVFVDNRPEAYPIAFFQEVYKPMQFDKAHFDKFVDQYGIRTIIWGRRDITDWSVAFLSWLPSHSDWKPVYVDDAMVIYVKRGS